MVTIIQETEINASAEKIWEVLWNEITYPEWTKSFGPGMKLDTDWQVGGRTVFLDESGRNGMLSTIDKIEAPHEVIFKYIGVLRDGVQDTMSKEVMEWSGSQEKYILTEFPGYTKLTGKLQTTQEYEKVMQEGMQKGFQVVKELAENR